MCHIESLLRWAMLISIGLFINASSAEAQSSHIPTWEKTQAACEYLLPWSNLEGKILVTQENMEPPDWSHGSGSILQYAVDFGIPKDKPVLASRGGVVTKIHDGETDCGGVEKINNANFVIIGHPDGVLSLYLHLRNGIPVSEGQEVARGQIIGYIGNTGWTNCRANKNRGYHLHYQLQQRRDKIGESVPLCFAEVPGGVPNRGDHLVSQNQIAMVVTREPEAPEPPQPTDPVEIMTQDCLVAPDSIADGPMETFIYFRDLWREAGVIPQPEPQSFWDMEHRMDYNAPLNYHYGTDRPPHCTYLEIPVERGYCLVYRTKAGEARKIFVETVLEVPTPTGRVAYRTGHTDSFKITVIDVSTGAQIDLVKLGMISDFAWSPDASKIAYVEHGYDTSTAPPELTSSIILLDLEENIRSVLVAPQKTLVAPLDSYWYYSVPRWSRQENSLYFLAVDGRASGFTLRKVDLVTGNINVIVDQMEAFDFDVTIGDNLVIRQWFNGHNGHGLFVAKPDGTYITTIIDPKLQLSVCCARWSPDGTQIVFAASGGQFGGSSAGPKHLWLVSANSLGVNQLTFDVNYDDSDPAWSPDGMWITFSRKGESDLNIWIVDITGNHLKRLTNTQAVSEMMGANNPEWKK